MDRDQLTTQAATYANASLTAQAVHGPGSPQHQQAQDDAVAAIAAAFDAGVPLADSHRQAEDRL